jgi:myo-inositol-1(or 4)-monophosphatase
MSELFTSRSFSLRDLERAHAIAYAAVRWVAPILRENYGAGLHDLKENEQSWVTTWDKWAEEVLRENLAAFSRDVGVSGEEGGAAGAGKVRWSVDPIDGTTHFVRGTPWCMTMAALIDHGSPVVSVMHNFITGDTSSAIAGQGAYLNQTQPLRVSNRPLSQACLELYTDEESIAGQRLRHAIERTGAYLLRTAAAGNTFAMVARGSTEGFVMAGNPYGAEWDIAPGALLAHEAGALVRNIGSDGYKSTNFDVIAANPETFHRLTSLALHEGFGRVR